jgi:hypothetical protein
MVLSPGRVTLLTNVRGMPRHEEPNIRRGGHRTSTTALPRRNDRGPLGHRREIP